MTAAAQTPGLTNPPTGKECLLAFARWLLALLFVHLLIYRARELTAAFQHPATVPDDTVLARRFGTTDRDRILSRIGRALHRAAALEADLLAHSPTRQGLPPDACRVIAARIDAICRDLGMRSRNATHAVAQHVRRRVLHHTRPTSTAHRSQTCPIGPLRGPIPVLATGPPQVHLARAAGEVAVHNTAGEGAAAPMLRPPTRVYPWSFSRRAPAFAC